MMVPCQKISAKNGRNSLLIKIFEKDKLNPRQVKSITGYFKEIFANSPIDDFEILITVTPLTDVFDAYVLFVKSNDISYYHPGFGVNVLACLREILELFIGGFNGLNINDYEIEEAADDNGPGLKSGPVDVDGILRAFKNERKNKREE
ncbi:MAG: hypothetical protein A3B89_04760 [Candidatus Buchananbacteria bacterium RIFCSPHIGHO2_02_FULL_40_13]|uniref:Uncharacterized protein n=1 Tax=Candidatus Buchananbacteria bacterium RIFCSPLOWO2_01_FULL_39_33 TaxID=1797543 RepID=A0A1G1YN76_9BACT|nr:MAG: hypothetical protein A2820_00535 [Candidatus Buchananbacteria bacterium RIFCSPHIGHO2_01_FULL_40_35]OGY51095.1 MAG: hypothetical protein A3B89_04760 [Candidatus Buchananbacteria bacterium RIFCSPHIGHO2_02_FULL_40_13]OGY53256.1 MAG: hypothetical protein A3A02_01040 [Candidatus Buchananbacteria bacterium RIFCSPLOWO2_01_FULL_39_33]